MEQIDSDVAECVQRVMSGAGVDVADLVERTGMPDAALRRRLAGRSSFTIAELVTVARALDCPVDALLPHPGGAS
ncbi:helix-turn-helix domain-containing protein [Nocardia huaxiensis]|uniref:Helix-turn-helix transcriptional regulator n=1 Tax=Nocardia huaxiensis TaxID=2755382 RepID=A0A7D6Z4D0_9NOCA|nr:helix-turn-helix transcriptional regulator [Nocardia huaxiensis]QLY30844.1 helix-turn-helix transcriptional regulator [Nocardia huaxiensis]UFS94348.1 helix-turn-helix domain-containing protein [Nocardia huaxiensis]